mgnify:CR=1 FL=1
MKNARSYATNHGGLCMATDNGAHVVMLPTMVDFVWLLIMGHTYSFATNHGETCMINVLRYYARSYVTNNGGLCKTADNKGKGQ